VRILIAPDKFKGSLTAAQVAAALATGVGDRADVTVLPLADGGDGSVEAAASAGFVLHGKIAFDGHTALVEVANTCGIALLRELDPLGTSTFALGEAIHEALALAPRRIVIALGGSASTDGGAGMLAALGVRFLDATGDAFVPTGGTLSAIHSIDSSGLVTLPEIVCATDVDNPLTGPRGAAAVFGPQKGAIPAHIALLDAGLTHLATIMRADAAASRPGAGAAGGTGFAALTLGATIVSGADFFLDLLGFDRHLEDCDLVVTGEGQLDEQTAAGKLVAVVAPRAAPVPVVAVVGRSLLTAGQSEALGLSRVFALSDRADTSRDPVLTEQLLEQVGRELAR
jgi:glycerate kinase